MKFKNNKVAIVLSLMAFTAFSTGALARPNINSAPGSGKKGGSQAKTTASTCKPAEANIDLDINNVRARLMTGGDMWWDIGVGVARYEVPKGTLKNSLFAGSVWIGGYDAQKQLKVAAQTYRQDGNDYWPGPLDQAANITQTDCSEWDRFWKVNRETVNRFRDMKDKTAAIGDGDFDVILQWPAKGNTEAKGSHGNTLSIPSDRDYAPFEDVDNNGIYNPIEGGDYPKITGDQFIWWVFNDKGNVKQQSQTEGIGIEVQASAFAYAAKDFLNDATFYNYRLINRGNLKLDSTFISTWTDADLGYYKDDYIGCDVTRGLGILYNGKSTDGNGEVNSYGDHVPMVGVDFFKGPRKPVDSAGTIVYKQLSMEAFTYYNNDGTSIGNPSNGTQIYNYMTGSIRTGERFTNDFNGVGVNSKGYGSGPITKYVFTGDPGVPTEWSECACNNPADDRRFVHSSGPFVLQPGVVNDITIGVVWVADVGGCPNTSFKKIRVADDGAQDLFDRGFKTIEGPEAPRLTVREMDRKLVFYITNDSSSTNYQEKFGRDTAKKFQVASSKAHRANYADSIYKFEGYRVFQLKDATVTPADIFSPETGEVNKDKAIEVFQSDVRNGVSRIVNYNKRVEISDTSFIPQLKVDGKDSGIKHSFVLSIDQFAKSTDKKFVNYRNYYFVAIAYAYNNFAPFNPRRPDSTQDAAYLESQHGPNGTAIPVVVAMPNPANGDMGTVLNSDYGDGVKIQRLEGIGNGGNDLEMDEPSEAEALANGQSLQPFYNVSHSPVDVKIIDPVKIKPYEWMLYLNGPINDPAKGMVDSLTTWKLVNNTTGDVIYSESDMGIKTPNEQIIEKYGLSVNIMQVKRPQDDQTAANTGVTGKGGNGLIDSRITFENPDLTWLAGVKDGEQQDRRNWIRSGRTQVENDTVCNFDDLTYDTIGQFYENLLPNYTFTNRTWAPYALGSNEAKGGCGFGTVYKNTGNGGIYNIHSVDVVFTSDKSKWSRCAVLEMQEDPSLSQGNAAKFDLRSHRSWNLDLDDAGRPVYSTDPSDTGMSWFPGYAIDQETGDRLNIIFGEDSYLKMHNGADMIWNPTSVDISSIQATNTELGIYGGKHVIYVLPSRYDKCDSFLRLYRLGNSSLQKPNAYKFMWTGFPLLNQYFRYLPLSEGLIPTTTRVQIRVNRPYTTYHTTSSPQNGDFPLYRFNTADQAATPLSNNANSDKQALLDRIHAVPNPYYGYAGYETNRLDTRVRIINLPQKATVSIYSLDGTLINKLTKDNPNVSYVDWNVRNFKELPIASGMYLIHVNAEGIGETVIRWFGAMRPLDVITN